MADLLPHPTTPPRASRDWHAYDNYKVVHENHIAALTDEGVIVSETLTFRETVDDHGMLVEVNLRGRIYTRSGCVVIVNKWLSVERRNGRDVVLTREYDYHAYVREPRRDVFRYDNCHGSTDSLHRHHYDVSGKPVDTATTQVRPQRMPVLSDVIREAEFYADHHRQRASN